MAPDSIGEDRQSPALSSLDRYDLIFIALIALAFVLRLYYFFLTKDQPLWWDEAEYMLKAKALVFGTPATGWRATRPIFLPYLAAAFLKIGGGETTVRVLWIALSTIGIFFVSRIGALLFNRRVGLYAALLSSVFYIDLFYYTRLLVDASQVFFILAAAFLLVRSLYGAGTKRGVRAIFPVLVLGTAMRFTAVLFFAVLGVFLLLIEGTTVWKKRDWRIATAFGFLTSLPLMIYFWTEYGNPLYPFLHEGVLRDPSAAGTAAGGVFLEYARYFPNYTSVSVTVVFIAGMFLAAGYVARRFSMLRADPGAQAYCLLLLWIVIPFIFFGFFVNHFEDRFLSMIFPAVFLLTGAALDAAFDYIKRYSLTAAAVAVGGFLTYAALSMAANSDAAIKDKLTSFAAIRDAGLWIKARTRPGDVVVTSSVRQNTYYSERASYAIPKKPEDFERLLAQRRPKFLVLSLWEQSPAWAYRWPEANAGKATLAAVFFFDEMRKAPAAAVYAFGGG